MKTKHIIYPVTFMLMFVLPFVRYYISTPWINACVLDYVDGLEDSNYKWYLYDINWMRHIEPKNSDMNIGLEEYKVWEANWCIMASNNLYIDLTNTFYCTITYIIKKAPIKKSLKKPFGIYDWTDIKK